MAKQVIHKLVVSKALDELEQRIEHLKIAFDRYFFGVDKVPPVKEKQQIERHVRSLMSQPMSTTVLRFRFGQLRQRLSTYSLYWNRILLQIENGTYKRVVAVSQRRQRQGIAEPAADAAGEAAPEAKTGGPPPLPGKKASAPGKLPDGMNATEARQLFKQFVTAKKAAGEQTSGLTYGGLVQKLAKELPKLQQKHGSKIRFEVSTVNGKVKLRARGG